MQAMVYGFSADMRFAASASVKDEDEMRDEVGQPRLESQSNATYCNNHIRPS